MTSVSIKTSAFSKYSNKFARVRAFADGADAIKNGTYIVAPRAWDYQEKNDFYETTYLFNATKRTIDGFSGMITLKPATIDLPPEFDDLRKDIDGIGTSLDGIINKIADELCGVGNLGFLVDYPVSNEQVTIVQANAQGLRPAMSIYTIESILEVKYVKIGNQYILQRVRLAETYSIPNPNDEFSETIKPQVRVLDLSDGVYRMRIFRNNEVFLEIFPRANGQLMQEIPFRLITATGDADKPCRPMLDDLAEVNIAHLNNSAWHEHGLPTIIPTFWFSGVDKPEKGFRLGFRSAGFGPQGSDAKLLQASAEAFGALVAAKDSKIKDMAVIGARFLQTESNANIAENTAVIHRSGDKATLASISASIEVGVTQLLQFCALFMGIKADIGIKLSRDYLPTNMTSQDLTALVAAWQNGSITIYDLYDNLVKCEIIQPREGGAEQFKDELDEEQIQPDIYPLQIEATPQKSQKSTT